MKLFGSMEVDLKSVLGEWKYLRAVEAYFRLVEEVSPRFTEMKFYG